MTVDKRFGQSEFFTQLADLVFKKVAQRFHQADEGHVFRQSADVVVAFDVCGIVRARFDDVGIDRALRQKLVIAVFFRLVLKDVYKFRADDLAFLFGIGNARKLC